MTAGSETCRGHSLIEHSADPEIPDPNLTLLLISRASGGDILSRIPDGAFESCGNFKCSRQSTTAGSALKRGTLRIRSCAMPDASCCTLACLRHSEPA